VKVLEILNSFPGETFIQEHARAITEHSSVDLSWAFWQTKKVGAYKKKPVVGLKHCIGLINPNRISKIFKAIIWARYLGHKDCYKQALMNQINAIKPDIIHFQFATLAVQHYKWVCELGIPFTFSIRGSDIQTQCVISKSYVDMLKILSEKAAAIHSVSDQLKLDLFKYCGNNSKTTVIRTAIDNHWVVDYRNPVKGQIVTVGRLHWRKGFSDLLIACHLLKKLGIGFHLIIIGEGNERAILEYMIRDLDLSAEVTLKGSLDQSSIKEYFKSSDFFVLSSLAEGFPNVAAEAALARVPMVATKDSFVAEIFEDEKHCLLAETGVPEKLAFRMKQMMEMNLTDKLAMTEAAFSIAKSIFSRRNHNQEFMNFWKVNINNQSSEPQ
jgi:colanic acid/amylovoran biosynthesis glycosyltransferase